MNTDYGYISTARPWFAAAKKSLGPRLSQVAVFGVFFVALIVPPLPMGGIGLNVRPELIGLALIMVVYCWLLLAGLVQPLKFNPMFAASFCFCVAVVISMVYGADVLHHELLYRDYFEIPKTWLPALFFTLTFESRLRENSLRKFLAFMIIPAFLICIYAWTQFLRLDFAYALNPLYTGGEHVDLALQRYDRVYSTFGNPNVLGQYLSWTIITYAAAALFQVGNRIRNLAVVMVCMVTMVLTGSRYGLLATGFGLFVILFLLMTSHRSGTKAVGLFLLFATLSYTFVAVQRSSRHTQQRFQELRHPSEISSLRQRLDGLWLEAGDYITTSPFVGHGPAKRIFTDVFTDSEYLNVLKEFGIVGFIPYMCFYLWGLYYLRKALKAGERLGPDLERRYAATFLYVRVGFVMMLMALFMNIGMFTYFNWELMGFLWLMIGLSVSSAMRIISIHEKLAPSIATIRKTARTREAEQARWELSAG